MSRKFSRLGALSVIIALVATMLSFISLISTSAHAAPNNQIQVNATSLKSSDPSGNVSDGVLRIWKWARLDFTWDA